MEHQTSFLATRTVTKSEVAVKEKKQSSKKDVDTDYCIFTDGASRGNPGAAGAGVLVKQHDQDVVRAGYYLGEKTNNQAEYLALALAIFLAKKEICEKNKCPHFVVFADSELLVRQMSGVYSVKNPILKCIKHAIDDLLIGCSYSFRHVLREKNKEADALANLGIDKKKHLPATFVAFLAKYNVSI